MPIGSWQAPSGAAAETRERDLVRHRRLLLAAALVLALLAAGLWEHPARAAAQVTLAADPFVELSGALSPEGELGEGRFGASVALSADGKTALVGAPGDGGHVGAVWVFTRSGSLWSQQGTKLTVPEEPGEVEGELCKAEPGECGIGANIALSADGDTALIGAPRQNAEAGAAWVFTRSGSTWNLREQLEAGPDEQGLGRFGRSVALSADGATALVGAPRDHNAKGAVWAFRLLGGSYVLQGSKLVGPEESGEGLFGRSLAVSADGTTALAGAPGDAGHKGGAWLFRSAGAAFTQRGAELKGGGESGAGRFGSSVALSVEGNTALVGGRSDGEGAGAAWVFARGAGGWEQQGAKLTGADESGAGDFGHSAALSATGDTALIGGPRDEGPNGAVWVFAREGGVWSQQGSKLAVSDPAANNSFGWDVALSGNEGTVLVGAPRDAAGAGEAWSLLGTPVPAPAVTEVTPGSGPSAGGTAVTITGTGFLPGATVDIGAPATSVTVHSETEITAVTAPDAAGSEEVVVNDLYGSSAGSPSFTYAGTAAAPASEDVPHDSPLTGVLSSITSGLAAPKLGVAGNLLPVSGHVRIKVPGSQQFVDVGTSIQVPFGTIVDATLGRVSVTTAAPGGGTQVVTYYAGEFKLTQDRNGLVVATLLGGSFASCPKARHKAHSSSAQAAKKKPARKLWAEGHGKYSTKGNYATGAALGTRWVTEDRCNGTLIRVLLHHVLVTNLVTHRHFVIRAGHSYLARAPGR
jgi:hypothetical protein